MGGKNASSVLRSPYRWHYLVNSVNAATPLRATQTFSSITKAILSAIVVIVVSIKILIVEDISDWNLKTERDVSKNILPGKKNVMRKLVLLGSDPLAVAPIL